MNFALRQTAGINSLTGTTGYVYDAEGRRVEKVAISNYGMPQQSYQVEDEYLLGPDGEQVSVLDGSGNWQWTNVYAGGKQLATYDSAGTHFALTDWLGSKRVELSVTGPSAVSVDEQCQSLPFGDGLDCTGTDVNQLHYTGKERDSESGNTTSGPGTTPAISREGS